MEGSQNVALAFSLYIPSNCKLAYPTNTLNKLLNTYKGYFHDTYYQITKGVLQEDSVISFLKSINNDELLVRQKSVRTPKPTYYEEQVYMYYSTEQKVDKDLTSNLQQILHNYQEVFFISKEMQKHFKVNKHMPRISGQVFSYPKSATKSRETNSNHYYPIALTIMSVIIITQYFFFLNRQQHSTIAQEAQQEAMKGVLEIQSLYAARNDTITTMMKEIAEKGGEVDEFNRKFHEIKANMETIHKDFTQLITHPTSMEKVASLEGLSSPIANQLSKQKAFITLLQRELASLQYIESQPYLCFHTIQAYSNRTTLNLNLKQLKAYKKEVEASKTFCSSRDSLIRRLAALIDVVQAINDYELKWKLERSKIHLVRQQLEEYLTSEALTHAQKRCIQRRLNSSR